MPWKNIDGYSIPCRINEDGCVQTFYRGVWHDKKQRIHRWQATVTLPVGGRKRKYVAVSGLMADAFLGGRREGDCVLHKDKSKLNNAVWNLEVVRRGGLGSTGARKAVVKIDRDGNVVAVYKSATEAAMREYVSLSTISLCCRNKIKDKYRLGGGYTYQYEKDYRRRTE